MPKIVTLIWACMLLVAGNAFPADLPVIRGGHPPAKNVHVAPIKDSASAAISFGEKGDRDKGEILLEIPARDLKDLDFFYSGYPNGKSLRFELRASGKTPVVLDLKPAREGWLELLLRLPDSWSTVEDLTVMAIDESEEFTGWVGIAASKQQPLPARLFTEWRLVLAMIWVLAIGWLVCGPVFLHQASPLVRVALSILCIGCWSMLAFYIALLLPGEWHHIVLPAASGVGLTSWIFLLVRRSNSSGSIKIPRQQILAFIVAMACFLLPVIIAGPALKGEDPFTPAQTHYRDMPMDNRIPWILANAAMEDTYKSPLFEDWLGSDRPPLQSGLIILMQPALGWLPPAAGAFATSCAAQGFWVLGAMVLLWGLGLTGSVVKCALATAAISGLVLLNGIFTWPKLMSTGYLLASAGLLLCHLRKKADHQGWWTGIALPGCLAGMSMQCHGSAAFAILPLGAFLLFKTAWVPAGLIGILRNGLIFGSCFLILQIPWSLWQKLGDPPGNRLIKWHIAGVMPVDQRSTGETLKESYNNLTWEIFLKNKNKNLETLFTPPGLPITPWLSLEKRDRSLNADFFGVFPAMSWALPSWLALGFLCLYDPDARRKFSKIFRRFLPVLLWLLATAFVWVILMFIPGSTVNHQGPMNLSLLGLLFTGAALGAISPGAWLFATILQLAGVLFVYLDHGFERQTNLLWHVVLVVIGGGILASSVLQNKIDETLATNVS